MRQLDTPVALIVFNRPEPTERVFRAVANVRPKHLLLIADGPRQSRPGEGSVCEVVRGIVTAIDWPCQVETNFAERNMGCRERVISGLKWVFSCVEEAIVVEDDCLPSSSFFYYCSELLERHRDDHQVGMIAGFNAFASQFPFDYSYYYSMAPMIWGWATWRRAWKYYDENLSTWPEVKRSNILNLILPTKSIRTYWSAVFDRMHYHSQPSTWDYQWVYALWMHNLLTVTPRTNMVRNIGFGPDATHTKGDSPLSSVDSGEIEFPLNHPPVITPWPEFMHQSYAHVSGGSRLKEKLRMLRRKV